MTAHPASATVRPVTEGDLPELSQMAVDRRRRLLNDADLQDADVESSVEDLDGYPGLIVIGPHEVGLAILWRDGTHPLTKTRERQFFQVLNGKPASEAAAEEWGVIIDAAIGSLPPEVEQIRVEIGLSEHDGSLGEALRKSGFTDQILRIRKVVAQVKPPLCPEGVLIRPLSRDEAEFAVRCVSQAIIHALDKPVPQEQVSDFVRKWCHDGWERGALRSYVVVADDVLVAHALVSLQEAEAELVDVLIPDESQRGKGWSRLLGMHIEAQLSKEDMHRLGGTVVVPGGVYPHELVRNLVRSKWWVGSVSMIRSCT